MQCKCCKAIVSDADLAWSGKRRKLLERAPMHALARIDGRLVLVCLKNRKLT